MILLFESIASDEHWQCGRQLRSYSESSVWFSLIASGDLQGGVQLVRSGTVEGLPFLTVWPELAWMVGDRKDISDIALLAIKPECRRYEESLMWPLCIALFRYLKKLGVEQVFAEVTPARLRQYQQIGLPFQIVGPLRTHWGEGCYPVSMMVEDAARSIRAKAGRSQRYRRIVDEAYDGLQVSK